MTALPEHIRARLPRPGWLDIASREGLASELERSGFAEIEISEFDATLIAPSPRAMWEFMQENPPLRALLSQCTESELSGVERSVLSSFEEMAAAPDRPIKFEASCHFALAQRV